MSLDLAADLTAALKKRLQAAKAAGEAGDAPGQIAALDGASRLLFKLADVAPDGNTAAAATTAAAAPSTATT